MAADRYTTTMYDEWLSWLADQNLKNKKAGAQADLVARANQTAADYGSLPQDPGYVLSGIDTGSKTEYSNMLNDMLMAGNNAKTNPPIVQNELDTWQKYAAEYGDQPTTGNMIPRVPQTKALAQSEQNAAQNYGSLPQDTGAPIERVKKPAADTTQQPAPETPQQPTTPATPTKPTTPVQPTGSNGSGGSSPTGGSNPTPATTTTPTTPAAQQQANNQPQPQQAGQAAYDAPPAAYDPASYAAYQQALNVLLDAQGNAPTYTNPYETQLQNAYDAIVNRPKFNYDLNEDMLYRQYAQNYQNMGRMAMQDTMGQAAALTGGYGSSYGQAVGQQQYNAYLQQLNNVIPELYQQAYQQYRDEGNDLLNQYSILDAMAERDYGRYQDDYNRWLQNRNFAADMENQAYNRGLNEWRDAQDIYNRDRAFDNQQMQADREYQLALDKWNYQKEQDALAQAAAEQAAAGGSGGSGTRVGYDKHGYTEDMIRDLQRQAGLKETGVWGENEKQAYKAGYRATNDPNNTGDGANADNSTGTTAGAKAASGVATWWDAMDAMKQNGADYGWVSSLLREDEFNNSRYASDFPDYQTYLRRIVKYAVDGQ